MIWAVELAGKTNEVKAALAKSHPLPSKCKLLDITKTDDGDTLITVAGDRAAECSLESWATDFIGCGSWGFTIKEVKHGR